MGDNDSGDGPADPESVGWTTEAPWLEAAVSAVRPERSVASVNPVEAGGRRSTLVVRFADAELIVVRGGRGGREGKSVATEGALLAAITDRTAVPVPEPLGWGSVGGGSVGGCDETQGDGSITEWLATRFVEGEDLHERFCGLAPTTRHRVAGSFGRCLGELHAAFRFGGYGRIGADDRSLRSGETGDDRERPEASAWREWLVERGRESLRRLPAEFDDIADAARERLDAWTVETAPVPRLFPWDLRPGNALVADGEIAAIVDWEAPLAAGAALSVAKAEHLLADWYVPGEADALRRAFRAGYAEVRSVPVVDDVHRVVAVAEAAVDSRGQVTNPRYPPVNRNEAVQFHRNRLGDTVGIDG